MQKELALLVILSLILVLFTNEIKMLLVYFDNLTSYIEIQLITVCHPVTAAGLVMTKSLTLLGTTLAIAAIPAAAYSAVTRHQMPYIYQTIWIIWLISITKLSVS